MTREETKTMLVWIAVGMAFVAGREVAHAQTSITVSGVTSTGMIKPIRVDDTGALVVPVKVGSKDWASCSSNGCTIDLSASPTPNPAATEYYERAVHWKERTAECELTLDNVLASRNAARDEIDQLKREREPYGIAGALRILAAVLIALGSFTIIGHTLVKLAALRRGP